MCCHYKHVLQPQGQPPCCGVSLEFGVKAGAPGNVIPRGQGGRSLVDMCYAAFSCLLLQSAVSQAREGSLWGKARWDGLQVA